MRDLDTEVKDALQRGLEAARECGHELVLPEHLLIGAARTTGSTAAVAITDAGFDAHAALQWLKNRYPSGSVPNVGSTTMSPLVRDLLGTAQAGLPQDAKINLPALLVRLMMSADASPQAMVLAVSVRPSELLQNLKAAAEEKATAATSGPATHPSHAGYTTDADEQLAYCRDLTAEAAAGALDPVVGRETELARVVQILARRTKNNPVLLGDPGVGKSAVAEGLAQLLAAGSVPKALSGRPLLAVDLAAMLAGTRFRGEFEKRLVKLLEVAEERRAILFFDEVHTLVGAGQGLDSPMDAAQMLKESLARGRVTMLGATTLDEYRRHVATDAALERRFNPVRVEQPDVTVTVAILRALAPRYAEHHGVTYTDAALQSAARLADLHLPERQNPDKAIDVIDEAGSRAACQTGTSAVIDEADVAAIVSTMSGVPVGDLTGGERSRLATIRDDLAAEVRGQDNAVATVARAVRRRRAGLTVDRRPLSFLFAGPTGTGKTALSKTLADLLNPGQARPLIQFDMSEFGEKHTSARLFGAPPGYVGFEKGGQLTEAVRRTPGAVILLDEVCKAHPDIFDAILAVLEEGRMTDGEGRVVNFADTTIVMTTNLGAAETSRGRTGFSDRSASDNEAITWKVLRDTFRPEFLNRIDEVVVFNTLSDDVLRDITATHVTATVELAAANGLTVRVHDDVISAIIEKADPAVWGARGLKRAVATLLTDPLTDLVLDGNPTEADAYVHDGVVCVSDAAGSVVDLAPAVAAMRSLQDA